MKLSQLQMYEQSRRRIADCNDHFMDMINCKENPLTNADLKKLISKFPQRWGKYKGFLGKLKD